MGNLTKDIFDRIYVVVRWVFKNPPQATGINMVSHTLGQIKYLGYSMRETKLRVTTCPLENDQFLIFPMSSGEEAKRLVQCFEAQISEESNIKYTVNELIGPRGIRLQDLADCVRLWHEYFDEDNLLVLVQTLLRMEGADKKSIIERELPYITKAISELIENGVCKFFGSYVSQLRKNGYSDLDINVESIDTPEKQGSMEVRPLQHLIENPLCLIKQPLTKAELYTFPQEEIIKALYKCFTVSDHFNKVFKMRYIPSRTPIIMFQGDKESGVYDISYDVSVNNKISVEKANILDQFMLQDTSPQRRTSGMMMFLVIWAKSNGLMGGAYPDEKLATKTRFNSYVINQMVIHFIQVYANQDLVFPKAKEEERVIAYNFDEIFNGYQHFLKEFFKYYANFDFIGMATYGRKKLQKKTVSKVHGVPVSPLMIMDPMDYTHNLTAKVPEEALKLLNGLIRNALLILKQKEFRLSLLLRTNHNATQIQENKSTHTCNTTTQLPSALSEFASVCANHKVLLTFQLPPLITNSADFMTLLTRVLRFQISPNQAGPSIDNLYNSKGIAFIIYSRAWMGRRNMKKAIKKEHPTITNLKADLMCSDQIKLEDDPIAEFRVVLTDDEKKTRLVGYIDMLHGHMKDLRDAMHFLVDQFLANNLAELRQIEGGISCINQM